MVPGRGIDRDTFLIYRKWRRNNMIIDTPCLNTHCILKVKALTFKQAFEVLPFAGGMQILLLIT